MIQAGNYEGRAVEEKFQMGESGTGTLQLGVDMELFDGDKSVGVMTALLYFSDGAAVYSYERLRALGWKGTGPEDIDKPAGIRDNKVPCRVTAPEKYKDSAGVEKMGVSKLEILSGGGTLIMNKPLDAATFKARLKAIGGSGGGSAPASNAGAGGKPPPF